MLRRKNTTLLFCRVKLIRKYGLAIFLLSILSLSWYACSDKPYSAFPKHEVRAAWIATVKNIDWPSAPGLPTYQQKEELRLLIDSLYNIGINTVILQVRPAADALYQSDIEPWSQWLTGKQGKAPDPYYDPLAFAIKEAHYRGMELHAWFNPYRAIVDADSTITDSLHITHQKPAWFVRYGDRIYFDPGIPEVRTYATSIIQDVVRRYDIDAVHFDDYFYPYKIDSLDFPDSVSFTQFGNEYDVSHKNDWRRNNVNQIIKMLNDSIKAIKPYVKFGISPFGVWRNQSEDPSGSATAALQTNYDDLYADVLTWLRKGWIDYVVPQLYWHVGFELADYEVLLRWWSQHTYGRHLYIGQGAYRIGPDSPIEKWQNPSEMPNQLRMNRQLPQVHGSVYFSAKSLKKNPLGISDSLQKNFYSYPALISTMPWIDSIPPLPPINVKVTQEKNAISITWNEPNASQEDATSFVIYRFEGKSNLELNDPRNIVGVVRSPSNIFKDPNIETATTYTYVVTALDRLHNESAPSHPVSVKFTL